MKPRPTKRLDDQGHRLLALWAADCAEHVLLYFEAKYPQDIRPRQAIEAARAWARGDIRVGQARVAALAAHAAARDVEDDAARAAARAAGHAAATAHVATHARGAASYAVKAAAASSAAKEFDWQLQRLPTRLQPAGLPARSSQQRYWRDDMFEIPEYVTIARQMTESLTGKRITQGSLGNSPHKFVWYNLEPAEFASKVKGKIVGKAYTRGRWLFVPTEPGYVLVFGECGGKILLHKSALMLPLKYHLSLHFEEGTALSATTQMWGAMELYEKGKELGRQYIKGMRTTPTEPGFTTAYLSKLIKESTDNGFKTVKAILTQGQMIPGLGNAIAQDIMFKARLNPKQPLDAFQKTHVDKLHRAIVGTLQEAIRSGGRNDEFDLYGNPGRYVRLMDKNAVGRPCPECATKIEDMSYLGGTCYYCPACQKLL